MRNVNLHDSTYSPVINSRFYINYEECKFQMIGFGQAKKESFILTMRNVNKSKEYELQMIRLGFILTMRNVNKFRKLR